MPELKIKFRDKLESFAQVVYGSPLSKLNDIQRTDALTLCYLKEIRGVLLPGSIPDEVEDLKQYVTDGKNDRTVDFFYRDDSGHVVAIQSKHRSSDKSEALPEFESFSGCLRKLCPETRPPGVKINQRLLDLIPDVDWENDTFSLIYLSLARSSEQITIAAEQEIQGIPNSPLADLSNRSELIYLSEDELNKNWRDVVAGGTGTTPKVELRISHMPSSDADYVVVENAAGIRSYIATLSAPQIHHLYGQHRDKLFNLNIRNYIGDTRTNKGVIDSAEKEGDFFYLYNNGISAVARKVTPQKDKNELIVLSCDDFSVINGAQTFRSVSKAYTRATALDRRKVNVLIRISELDFRKPEVAVILDNITRYNNTQNAMKLSDFRSNDAVQTSLVRYVSNVPAWLGKSYVYRNKRTQGSERSAIVIKMDDFCRAIFSYQFGPADMFGGLAYLYDTQANGGYVRLFGKDLEPLSETEFDRLFAIWLITTKGDELLKDEKASPADDIRRNALERKAIVFFEMGEVIRELAKMKGSEEEKLLRSFSKPRWQDDEKRRTFVGEVYSLAADIVVQCYQQAMAAAEAKGEPFVHRNFFRDQGTLASLRGAKSSRLRDFKRLKELSSKIGSA